MYVTQPGLASSLVRVRVRGRVRGRGRGRVRGRVRVRACPSSSCRGPRRASR